MKAHHLLILLSLAGCGTSGGSGSASGSFQSGTTGQSTTTGSTSTTGSITNPGNIAGQVFNLAFSGNSNARQLGNFVFGPNNSIFVRGMFFSNGNNITSVGFTILEGRNQNGSSLTREFVVNIVDSDPLAVGDIFTSQESGTQRASLRYTEDQPPGNWVSSGIGTVRITGLQLLGGAAGRIALDFANVQLNPFPGGLATGSVIINGSVNVSL